MTKPKYTPEIRERAVRLVLESEKDYFYPDFIAELVDGSMFGLEYKGG